jgi:Spy/CpxP family protein refolding chaperone
MQIPKSKNWSVLSLVLVVFLLGLVVGALTMHLYRVRHKPSPGPQLVGQAIRELNLTAEQQAQVEAILDDTRNQLRQVRRDSQPKVSEIRRQARQRLQGVLTPQQWQKLDEKMKQRRGAFLGPRSANAMRRDAGD